MKSDYITDETLPPTVAVKQVTIGDTNIKTYTPDFLPKPIPEDVLKGSEENDFYYYLFLNPNRKTIFYQYKTGSKSPEETIKIIGLLTKAQKFMNAGFCNSIKRPITYQVKAILKL